MDRLRYNETSLSNQSTLSNFELEEEISDLCKIPPESCAILMTVQLHVSCNQHDSADGASYRARLIIRSGSILAAVEKVQGGHPPSVASSMVRYVIALCKIHTNNSFSVTGI